MEALRVLVNLREGPAPIWILTSVVLIGGYYGIAARYERALERSSAASGELQARIAVNELTLARASALRDQERRARDDLTRVSRENRLPRSTAELLEQLQRLGRAFHVLVISVVAQRKAPTPPKALEDLPATPFAMEVQGEFPSLLRFMQELPRHKTLIGIDSVQLALSRSKTQVGAPLTGTIRATLYRLALR